MASPTAMSYADIDFATVPAAPPARKNHRATSCPAPISAIVPYQRRSRLICRAFCKVSAPTSMSPLPSGAAHAFRERRPQGRSGPAVVPRPATRSLALRTPGRRGPPRGPPLRRLEPLGHVDRLAGDLVTAELEDVDAVVHRPAVIPDLEFHGPDVVPAAYPTDLDLHLRWIPAPPLPEVGDALEPLTRLRELEDRARVVDLVRGVLVGGGAAVEVALQGCADSVFIHGVRRSSLVELCRSAWFRTRGSPQRATCTNVPREWGNYLTRQEVARPSMRNR